MIYKSKGMVIAITEQETGTSKAGNEWTKQTLAIEFSDGKWPTQQAYTAFNERTQELASIKVNDVVEVSWTFSSRPYNGRWYSDINMVGIKNLSNKATRDSGVTVAPNVEGMTESSADETSENDMPF